MLSPEEYEELQLEMQKLGIDVGVKGQQMLSPEESSRMRSTML